MICILRSDGAYVAFHGMDQAAIVNMLAAQGLTCTVVSEADFLAVANRPR